MRNLLALILFALSATTQAGACDKDVLHFSVAFANAFESEKLKELDSLHCFTEEVLITVEHSLGGGEAELNGTTGETSIKSFKNRCQRAIVSNILISNNQFK